jgi:hypothetical protein
MKYSLEIITDPTLLTECFELRYEIYSKVFPKSVKHSLNHVESDEFDCRSIHLGLFCESLGARNLIGYCRFILPAIHINKYSDYLIRSHFNYPNKRLMTGEFELHFIEGLPQEYRNEIGSFCSELKNHRMTFIETSRFIVREEHRGLAVTSFFTSSMILIAKKLKIDYAFFSCSESHMPYYLRAGLTKFPDIEIYVNQRFGDRFMVFGTDLNKVYQNSFNIVITDSPEGKGVNLFKAQQAA